MKFYIFIDHLGNSFVVSDEGSFIPTDEGNRDYQAYLAWVAEGNVAEEWTPDANQ